MLELATVTKGALGTVDKCACAAVLLGSQSPVLVVPAPVYLFAGGLARLTVPLAALVVGDAGGLALVLAFELVVAA